MAHGDEIFTNNGIGIGGSNYRAWKMLDESGTQDDDSGWIDVLPFTKFSLELSGIVSNDKAKIFGTNKENAQLSDAGLLIGSELTANGYTQFSGAYAKLRVIRTANAGGGTVTATLLAVK